MVVLVSKFYIGLSNGLWGLKLFIRRRIPKIRVLCVNVLDMQCLVLGLGQNAVAGR